MPSKKGPFSCQWIFLPSRKPTIRSDSKIMLVKDTFLSAFFIFKKLISLGNQAYDFTPC